MTISSGNFHGFTASLGLKNSAKIHFWCTRHKKYYRHAWKNPGSYQKWRHNTSDQRPWLCCCCVKWYFITRASKDVFPHCFTSQKMPLAYNFRGFLSSSGSMCKKSFLFLSFFDSFFLSNDCQLFTIIYK